MAAKENGRRLGAHIQRQWNSPDEWAAIHKELGHGAAYSPVQDPSQGNAIKAYAAAAEADNLVIAEERFFSPSSRTTRTHHRPTDVLRVPTPSAMATFLHLHLSLDA